MKIIDCVSYNGEVDLFCLRYEILKDYVDEFIVVEFDKTFSGKDKPFYGKELDKRFVGFQEKIRYNYLTESTYGKYRELAEASPNTKGAEHWKREFMMKESIKDCLTHLKDDDIVFVGDTDEIYEPYTAIGIDKLKLRVYTYYLNNRSTEEFWGTITGKWGYMKDECLNELRSSESIRTKDYHGWHFTSMAQDLRRKLTDSYTEESYATKQVLDNLENNIENNRDFLGRDFEYKTEEKDWPDYLKANKDKYKHLIK